MMEVDKTIFISLNHETESNLVQCLKADVLVVKEKVFNITILTVHTPFPSIYLYVILTNLAEKRLSREKNNEHRMGNRLISPIVVKCRYLYSFAYTFRG